MIADIEDFFTMGCGRCARFGTQDCSTQLWAGGLAELRAICLGAGLAETVKWGHPAYAHAGRNVAIIGAHRKDFRLSFFEAGLMTDPDGVLERQGPNTVHPDMIRFTDAGQPARMAATIRAYLQEAMGYAGRGIRAAKATVEVAMPEEMSAALDADPELAEAFAALTPGRRKSYAIALASAKKPETRVARIARFRGRILAGKGATEL